MQEASLTLLGTGASTGVPVLGCTCSVCSSNHPYNQRSRTSALLRVKGKMILIDAGPDLRFQALRAKVSRLDGVLFTHAHSDHTAGVDDLRIFFFRNSSKPIPCLLSEATKIDLERRYWYMFEHPKDAKGVPVRLDLQALPQERGDIEFVGIPIRFMTFEQGGMSVNGFRFGDIGYISDIKHYNESIFEDLKGVKTLVLSALRFSDTEMHLTIDEAVAFSKKVGAEKTWLTHLGHELDYESTNEQLPPNIRLAYDGIELALKYPEGIL